MPSAPEIRDTRCQIRTFKVFIQRDAENLRRARRDIYAAGKIAINLYTVPKRGHCDITAAQRFRKAENIIHHYRYPVGNDHFFERAPKHQLHAEFYPRIGKFIRAEQLLRKRIETPNRPLYDLREKRYEQRQLCQISFRLHLFPVNVNQIAHGLERIKRNTQRQKKPEYWQFPANAQPREQRVQVIADKAGIFQHGKYSEVEQKRRHKDKPFFPCKSGFPCLSAFFIQPRFCFCKRSFVF